MKSITKYINEAQNTEKVIRFNTAELTYVNNCSSMTAGSCSVVSGVSTDPQYNY